MKKALRLIIAILFPLTPSLFAANDTFIDYQNFNHGYCPTCYCYPCTCAVPPDRALQPQIPPPPGEELPPIMSSPPPPGGAPPCGTTPCATTCAPCDPCAPIVGLKCGVSFCAVGVAIVAIVGAAAIVIATSHGASHS